VEELRIGDSLLVMSLDLEAANVNPDLVVPMYQVVEMKNLLSSTDHLQGRR
jgi:hypothetical protein